MKNTQKLAKKDNFQINPFLVDYLANFAYGNTDPESIAKVLLYPRALGTSSNTGFGNYIQALTTKLKNTYPSSTSGMDIDFIDAVDKRRKYCQIKAGPQTINKDDVETIVKKCDKARRLIQQNGGNAYPEDFIVGVCYGEKKDLSANYKKIAEKSHPVLIGKDFWYHLTGNKKFYDDLIAELASVAEEINASAIFEDVLEQLTEDIRNG